MSLVDPVIDALTIIRNAENSSKKECKLSHASNLLGEILKVAKENSYIESFEKHEENKKVSYNVKLSGKMNTCKGVRPRYAVRKNEYEKYEKRYLPARDVGLLVISTSQGVMTHAQAKAKGLGGRIVAYMY